MPRRLWSTRARICSLVAGSSRLAGGSPPVPPAAPERAWGGAAGEGVDDDGPSRGVEAHEEVPRERHPPPLDAGAAADLDEHHRQRDGDARAALDHLVEEAVPGVVVVAVVAAEARALVDEADGAGDPGLV